MLAMLHCGKKQIGAFLACILIFSSVFFSYVKDLQLQNNIARKNFPQAATTTASPVIELCKGKPAQNAITPLKGNRTLIITPYFDDREKKLTRVIGIVHHEDVKELYCWFCCQPDGKIYVSKASIDVHSDRFGFPYGATDINCLEPESCDPTHVSIHQFPHGDIDQLPRFEIKNRKAEPFPVDFTLCISAMFGNYNSVLQFIQSMEMYKILGVQKVMIYKNNCSHLMEKVLKFYIEEGIVEIIPWPIDSHLKVSHGWRYSMDSKDIGYYGQITALNDCVYRNMQRSKFVILNDADEIILPLKHPDWKTMMHSLQQQNPGVGVFLFENHIFPKTVTTPVFNISSWNAVPGVNILQHVHREPIIKKKFNPRKIIVDPKKVIQTSVHSVLRAYGKSVKVPRDFALIYHCRMPLQASLPRESLIRDTTLWKYNSSLITNVNKVLHQTVLQAEGRESG
ncbi:beta-1,4-galactosyltransferase galt-1-like [Melanerpes formicivorus]|uniref:beta-1,4-galactosyltransferase galt-1-like n=1 Tax=Melanerpes formicivorus TaxID=211600 RepID=UPI0035902E5C